MNSSIRHDFSFEFLETTKALLQVFLPDVSLGLQHGMSSSCLVGYPINNQVVANLHSESFSRAFTNF